MQVEQVFRPTLPLPSQTGHTPSPLQVTQTRVPWPARLPHIP